MAIDFPNTPVNGDSFTSSGKTWTYDGEAWTLSSPVVFLGASSVTTAKIANNAVTTPKIANSSVTHAKLASNISAITITTSANRATDIPSPFLGQLTIETDNLKLYVWTGSAWLFIGAAPPDPPTGLSATPFTTSVQVSFAAGSNNGSDITNYEYALSTDGGATYSPFSPLSPADASSPITIEDLTSATAYRVKLKAVTAIGVGLVASAALSFTTT